MAADPSNTPALRIVQITDTHLYAEPDGKLLGLNTRHCLQQVVELARQKSPQLAVATGDLTHDGSASACQAVRACLDRLGVPVYCLPGNHDEAGTLRRCLNDERFHATASIEAGGWQLVFLDSTVSGSEGGHLGERELRMLDDTLSQGGGAPALLWLHHQPVPVGSRWLDTMAVDNPQDFFAVVDRHPQVRGIVWGHVHQHFEQRHGRVRLLSTPSTCIQFLPGSDDFAVDDRPPGYRWFELFDNGEFTTGVERLADIPGSIDRQGNGY